MRRYRSYILGMEPSKMIFTDTPAGVQSQPDRAGGPPPEQGGGGGGGDPAGLHQSSPQPSPQSVPWSRWRTGGEDTETVQTLPVTRPAEYHGLTSLLEINVILLSHDPVLL